MTRIKCKPPKNRYDLPTIGVHCGECGGDGGGEGTDADVMKHAIRLQRASIHLRGAEGRAKVVTRRSAPPCCTASWIA